MNVNKNAVVNEYQWTGKKVLVTGASGFKGSWLCQVLVNLGAEVYGVTRPVINPMSAYSLFDLDRKISKITTDISNMQQVHDLINTLSPDVIFHLAAKAQVPVALRDPIRAYEVNIMGTLNIIEACRRFRNVKKLLIVSTDHVFGMTKQGELPVRGYIENAKVSYGGPYDTSKSAMELCVRSYHSCYAEELPAIGITRAANVYGYGDVASRRVIPNFVRSALENKFVPLTCRNNGRQFIYISDIVEGYIRATSILDRPDGASSPFTPTFHFAVQDYNKQDGACYVTISELADLVADVYGAKVAVASNCVDWAENENPLQALNCDETFRLLSWQPHTQLREGIGKLGTWYSPEHMHISEERKFGFLSTLMEEESNKVVDSLMNG